jgi:hypothetical protein
VKRTWKTGDTVVMVLPKTLRIEGLPDNRDRAALLWGPLVLAGDLGPEQRSGPTDLVPSFITDERPIDEWLRPVAGSAGVFRTVGRSIDDVPVSVDFTPFYRLHHRTYGIYWDLYTHERWKGKLAQRAGEKMRQRELNAVTLVFYQPGNPEQEKVFNPQGEEITRDRESARVGLRSKKWFSFELPLESATPGSLIVTYYTDERARRSFEVMIDDERIGTGTIRRSQPGSPEGRFYDVDYMIPEYLVKDKKKLTVRFQAANGDETATVFGIRLVRADVRD